MSHRKINRYEVRRDSETSAWVYVSLEERAYRVSDYYTRKRFAIQDARKYARAHAPSQLRVRDLKGRWKIEASYGVDSRRRKG